MPESESSFAASSRIKSTCAQPAGWICGASPAGALNLNRSCALPGLQRLFDTFAPGEIAGIIDRIAAREIDPQSAVDALLAQVHVAGASSHLELP